MCWECLGGWGDAIEAEEVGESRGAQFRGSPNTGVGASPTTSVDLSTAVGGHLSNTTAASLVLLPYPLFSHSPLLLMG